MKYKNKIYGKTLWYRINKKFIIFFNQSSIFKFLKTLIIKFQLKQNWLMFSSDDKKSNYQKQIS